MRVANPTAGDLAHWKLLREIDRNDELAEIAEDEFERSIIPMEPCRVTRHCTTPIKPGSHFAIAAEKEGSEDDYINRMKARYGGEW